MNTDSIFHIGKDHRVCQDYTISGIYKDTAYAIVCDGCSASPDVDIGARILAAAARETLLATPDFINRPTFFGSETIFRANYALGNFPLIHQQALDATLLVTFLQGKILKVFMYGDGIFVLRNKYGAHAVQAHITSGAPDYLSYFLHQSRKESYDSLEDNKKELWTLDGVVNYKPFDPITMEYEVESGDVAAVLSDGINSFRKPNNDPIEWRELVDEFTGYKSTVGEFVHRRIGAFKRKCNTENLTHSDDISVAAIVV